MLVTETERLLFKEFSTDDVDGFFEMNNDPEVLKYTGDVPFKNKEEVAAFIAQYDQYQRNGFGRWSLYLKETGQYIGFCGLKKSSETGEVDIGFRLIRHFWRKGYALESARATLALAFDRFNVDRVVARARNGNAASHALIKKLGMTYVSSFVEDGFDWFQYELSVEDWQANP